MELKGKILEYGRKVKDGVITWNQAATMFNEETGMSLSRDALRSRYRALNDNYTAEQSKVQRREYETHNDDGTIDICKEVWFDPNEEKTPEMILGKFGYSIEEWELISWTFGKWEVAIKDEENNRICTTIRAKIKPRKIKEISLDSYKEIVIDVLGKHIQPIQRPPKEIDRELKKDKLLELPAMELHLGKMAWSGDTGQDYDKDIAQERFYAILDEIVEQQRIEQCGTCLLCVGNDFFNSDTVNATTTRGTPQQSDLRWKKLYNIGLQLHIDEIETLRPLFNKIEVRYCPGNHDTMASFYLYIALACYYKDDKTVNFVDNFKEVQCFEWGKCAIAFTHGYGNLKRLIKSIPIEFRLEWAKCPYFELHLGHLHKEMVVDDDSGLITRRVGSPTGTDQYHYEERFIGATQKYQTFVWDKEKGLQNIKYINFESKKKQTRKLKLN